MTQTLRAEIQEALVRLANGDRSAFDPLFAQLWPLLRRFAERFLRGSPEAEDAAQQALLKVFARASEFDQQRDGLSWVFGIVAHECRSVRRKLGRRKEETLPPEDLAEHRAGEVDPQESLIERDLAAAAAEVLGTLAPQDMETILASIRGAGRPANVAAAAFRKRLQRALERLRLAWGVKYGSP